MFNDVLLAGLLSWNTPLLAGIISVAVIYVYLVRHSTLNKQPLFFFLGLSLLYLTIGSPLSTISHLFFSSHMVQMSILFFIIPPLLLLGIPNFLFQRIQKIPVIKRIGKLYLAPKVALYIFAVLFLMYHLPVVLTVLSESPILHRGYILLLFILSFSMWWPIASPGAKRRICKGEKKRYALLSGMLLLPACSLFILNGLIGTNNPFLSQLTADLCISPQVNPIDLFPFSINTRLDQFMGGALMLGMHKFGLVLTLRLGKTVQDHRCEET